jgi:hypothetical protein
MRLSIFAPKIRITLLLLTVVALIGGCANTSTLKLNGGQLNGKSVLLVPTGNVKLESQSNTVGPSFGLLGALIEAAVTQNSNAEAAKNLNSVMGGDFVLAIAQEGISAHLNKLGQPAIIKTSKKTLGNEEFTKWFNSDTRINTDLESAEKTDIIIDFGFQGLNVTTYLAGTFAEGTIGVRVIDANSKKVIARARTYGVGAFGGEKILASKGDENYDKAVVTAFDKLIRKLSLEAVNKISE